MKKCIRQVLSTILVGMVLFGSTPITRGLLDLIASLVFSAGDRIALAAEVKSSDLAINYNNEYDSGRVDVKWDGSLFSTSSFSSTPNYQLAFVAASLNAAADGTGSRLPKAYEKLGFEDITYYNYLESNGFKAETAGEYGRNEHCFSIAMRKMRINGEEQLVIAVVLRGTASDSPQEIQGDMNAKADKIIRVDGKSVKVFDYFLNFADKAKGKLDEKLESNYAKNFVKEKKYKILISGHSLGGAAANLLAVRLGAANNIYAYSFGALNTIGYKENDEDILQQIPSFSNIHNFFNYYDTYGPHGDGAALADFGRFIVMPWMREGEGDGIKPAYGSFTYEYKFGITTLFKENDYKKVFRSGDTRHKNHVMPCYIDLIRNAIAEISSAANKLEDYGYTSVLEKYRKAVVNGYYEYSDGGHLYDLNWEMGVLDNWGEEPVNFGWISFSDPNSSQDRLGFLGYAFHDLNDNQHPELILLTKAHEVFAIYTLVDGKTVKMLSYFEMRHLYCYLNAENNIIAIEDLNDFDYTVSTYRLGASGNELLLIDEVGWRAEDEYDDKGTYYKIENAGKAIPITKSEYSKSPLLSMFEFDSNYLEVIGSDGLTFIPLFDVHHEASDYAQIPSPATAMLSALAYPTKVTIANKQTVNIRSGPGTEYSQIGEVYPGASFYFTGAIQNDFYSIIYPNIKNNPQYDTSGGFGSYDLYVTAYVKQDLGTTSQTTEEDVILSSLIGNLEVNAGTQIYLDEKLKQKSKSSFSDHKNVPFAGIASSGAYAVLFNRTNDNGEQVLWVGFISSDAVVAESRLNE